MTGSFVIFPARVSADAPASPSSAAASTLPEDYRVGPGDVLSVTVALEPDMSGTALILPDGTVSLPRIGSVKVADKTLPEVQALIQSAFVKALKNPKVSVGISQPRPPKIEQVFVFGAVNAPGPVNLPPDPKRVWRVSEALASAGGLKFRPDWIKLSVTSNKGGMQEISAEEILKNPEDKDNLPLSPGDAIVAQEIPSQPIFISGAVAKPAMYDLREVDPKRGSVGVLEALTLAGGPLPDAALSQAYILRAVRTSPSGSAPPTSAASVPDSLRQEERVNLAGFQNASASKETQATSPDALRLYPGDTLYIPESNAKIVIMGKVKVLAFTQSRKTAR
jgi:polysaccharide export outer membrane protein